ncbi:MAG: hypothetical protein KAX49_10370 [Halanaerobiales bacterium]|nr:hypothetical protein [Halanaerobiales bacterium]
MKNITILIFAFLLCFNAIGLAKEYQIPDNFNQLIDLTYETIYRSLKVDDNLFYDVYLFDEYCMALSALARTEIGELSLHEMKEYFQKSLKKYDSANNFLLLIMVQDLKNTIDLSDFPSQVEIQNSQGESLTGTALENYNPVFILNFPKEKVNNLLSQDQNITIQIKTADGPLGKVIFNRNYEKQIPEKIRELLQILLLLTY